jgi:hypothetical protein
MSDLFGRFERMAAVRAGLDVARAALVRNVDHLRHLPREDLRKLHQVAEQMEEVAQLTIVWEAEIRAAMEQREQD